MGSPPRPPVLELAASKVAPFTAFDHLDSVWSHTATFCILGAVLCSAPLQLTCLAKGWCSMVKVPTSAVPERGSCGSSGRAWRLRAARYSQGEAQPLGAPPLPRRLKLAAS